MEMWSELALGTYIQFLLVHLQFSLFNEASSDTELVGVTNNLQHFSENLFN